MERSSKRLAGRSVVITGPASGIGKAIATAFAEEGADIAAIDGDGAGLQSLVTQIELIGRKCVPVHADLASEADIERAAQLAISELGDIHVIVNNAGVHLSKSLLDTTEDDWEADHRRQSARSASINEAGGRAHDRPGHKGPGDKHHVVDRRSAGVEYGRIRNVQGRVTDYDQSHRSGARPAPDRRQQRWDPDSRGPP